MGHSSGPSALHVLIWHKCPSANECTACLLNVFRKSHERSACRSACLSAGRSACRSACRSAGRSACRSAD
ncbi:hypothetical protein EYF80_068398 [Liparis tanakae]|uniref:Uncharacterized protein n=1 Tax=Liparis tanakae TaxID=230148 RepID=A0A4Z2DY57_9TELE|nr:hypothetical protein EYF80_068398 [Liparis tanakae]